MSLHFDLLLLAICISRVISQGCTGNGYYFHYVNAEQVITFIDRCTAADKLRQCESVKKVVEKYHPTLGVRPFDEFAQAYVECFAKLIMEKEKPILVELRQLKALITDIKYEMPKTLSTNVDSLLVKSFSNAQREEEISGEISEEITKTVETVKSRQHDWNIAVSVEAGVSDVFKVASVSVETSVEYSGSAGKDITTSSSRTYSISDKITVPPNSTVRVMWTMTEANVKIGWTSKMQISGMIMTMVNYVLYFIPVGDMALVYDEYFKRISSNAFYLESGGDLFTTTALQSTAHVNQFPLGRSPSCIS